MKLRRKTRSLKYIIALVFALGLGALYLFNKYSQLSYEVAPELDRVVLESSQSSGLAWPQYGQSAVATKDYGVLATHGSEHPQPTASTAKLITMLAVIQKRPINDGKGATITFTQQDVDSYNTYLAGNGTVTRVTDGLQWTQYQALQSIMYDSANNVSDSLAIWAFGYMESYREYARAMVKDIGMTNTTIGIDASGYSPTTTSTASDLALLAAKVLENEVLRDISNKPSATLPGVGEIINSSYIGDSEVTGMKNGYLPEAGGTYVLTGRQEVDEHAQDIIVVVLGSPRGPVGARDDAYKLYLSAKDNFKYHTVVSAGQKVGHYSPPWAERVSIVACDSLGMFILSGLSPEIALSVIDLSPSEPREVGNLKVDYGGWSKEVSLFTDSVLPKPPLAWALHHP